MIITDSGVHIWRAAGPDRPWQPGRKAHLETPIGYEELSAMMAQAGVDRAILVPPSWEGERIDYSVEAAAKYPSASPSWGAFPSRTGRAADARNLEGPAGHAGRTADSPSRVGSPVDDRRDRGLVLAGRGAAGHPGHAQCADAASRNFRGCVAPSRPAHHPRPHGPRARHAGRDASSGHRQTITLAKHPNVFVKLTQIPECSSPPYPYKTTQPYVRRVIEAFGPRRSFWGTDLSAMLSRTDCTYRQAVTLFTEEMKFLSPDDIDWIMGRGIAECLPWPVQ